MLKYAVLRVAQMVPVLVISSILVFLLIHLIPGDPAAMLAGEDATDEDIRVIREQLNLNDPLPIQFIEWSVDVLQGDLGTSFRGGPGVRERISLAAGPTLELAFVAFAIALSVGIPFGVMAGVRPGSIWDWGLSASTIVAIAIPNFVVGVLALWLFGFKLGWLPIAGREPLWSDPVESLRHLVLPALTLGLTQAAILARFTRSAVAQVMGQQYVTTARAKGLTERVVVSRHVLRNALISVITVASLQVASLITGSVVIERVFSRPGLGRLIVDAIQGRDVPVVQGMMLLLVTIFVLVNIVADVLYGVVNPRIRHS
ncbi:MAG: ABC transporter permease [Dehalococcoidia bacterium]|nr:ABC transporter permease [Dehalococcoidia bacterium]